MPFACLVCWGAYPSSSYSALSLVGTVLCHHFQSAALSACFLPDAGTINVESYSRTVSQNHGHKPRHLAQHTRSKAAIFLLLESGSASFLSGWYRPTRSVAGVSSSGARSVQIVLSFGFWEVGVKKFATADSRRHLLDITHSVSE